MGAIQSSYDVVIVGGGHNGLVSACYLARAGMSVLVAERNPELGGASQSRQAFEGLDARLSVYSYLISLFPEKIAADLGLDLQLISRRTASWTPAITGGDWRELLIRNGDDEANREAFVRLTGSTRDYHGFLKLQELQEELAAVVWPSLIEPLMSKEAMASKFDTPSGKGAWKSLIEEPIGNAIEGLIDDDLIRGLVFTDGKIGISTTPHDPSLLQNRCFLYHIIGRGTGEWRVPVGGMGSLIAELQRVATATGNVDFATRTEALKIESDASGCSVALDLDGTRHEVDSRFILCNASAEVLDDLTGQGDQDAPRAIEGAGFKINMLLERLPGLRSRQCTPPDAFAGTFHIDEGYEQMQHSHAQSMAGEIPDRPPGEIYCHTLSDRSILSPELDQRGFQTLTLFGLDMPYRLFEQDDGSVREAVVEKYLAGINQFLEEPIEGCLARDSHAAPCIEAMSAKDLEEKLRLPKGNIFHGDLSWPFADSTEELGTWGVETADPRILLCGSAARRGGAVSGIPGHNAAMKVLELR